MGEIDCVIFGFENTLADGGWLLQSPADLPTWELALRHGVLNRPKQYHEPWLRGELSAYDIAERIHNVLGISISRAYQIMLANGRKVRLFPNIIRLVQARQRRGLRQALLAVECDIFSDVTLPHYQLAKQFDCVVNSCDYGILDTVELSQRVFNHYGAAVGFHNSLLIDSAPHRLERFAAAGGKTYLFQTDIAFQDDLEGGALIFLKDMEKSQ